MVVLPRRILNAQRRFRNGRLMPLPGQRAPIT
jgi:hypothetical protein